MEGRKIIHIDMDCFYAAVEVRDNPLLKGKPVAVGGRADERGVLTTASYEARKFGLRSAMASSRAVKLCPDLILLPPNFEKYKAESKIIRSIFAKYTEKIEPLSLDEAYLDVSESKAHQGIATKIAKEIRNEIFTVTGLTASAGIAPNKFLAKIASDWKKPNGQFTITPDMVANFVKTLKVSKIPGVGKVTTEKMHSLGVHTCLDLQTWSIEQLQHQFGSWGVRLYDLCRGIDTREVSIDEELKSISTEITYNKDVATLDECILKLPELLDDLKARVKKSQAEAMIKSLVVKLKFYDFKQTTAESSGFKNLDIIAFTELLTRAYSRGNKAVRLIGIGVKLGAEKTRAPSAQLRLL
jgi:DNA polymerase-4